MLCGLSRYTLSATPRFFAMHRTSSETSSTSNTLPAAVRESSRRVHSASAFLAECAPIRSAAPHSRPRSDDSSVPVRCHSGSSSVVPARPRSRPAPKRRSNTCNRRYPKRGFSVFMPCWYACETSRGRSATCHIPACLHGLFADAFTVKRSVL